MWLIERKMSCHSHSGILKKFDEYEAMDPELIGGKVFRKTLIIIEAVRERRRRTETGYRHWNARCSNCRRTKLVRKEHLMCS